jgi:hypothetical protein
LRRLGNPAVLGKPVIYHTNDYCRHLFYMIKAGSKKIAASRPDWQGMRKAGGTLFR